MMAEPRCVLEVTQWFPELSEFRTWKPNAAEARVMIAAMREKDALILNFGGVHKVKSDRNTQLLLMTKPLGNMTWKHMTLSLHVVEQPFFIADMFV